MTWFENVTLGHFYVSSFVIPELWNCIPLTVPPCHLHISLRNTMSASRFGPCPEKWPVWFDEESKKGKVAKRHYRKKAHLHFTKGNAFKELGSDWESRFEIKESRYSLHWLKGGGIAGSLMAQRVKRAEPPTSSASGEQDFPLKWPCCHCPLRRGVKTWCKF